jgi:hypothetical protein
MVLAGTQPTRTFLPKQSIPHYSSCFAAAPTKFHVRGGDHSTLFISTLFGTGATKTGAAICSRQIPERKPRSPFGFSSDCNNSSTELFKYNPNRESKESPLGRKHHAGVKMKPSGNQKHQKCRKLNLQAVKRRHEYVNNESEGK